MYCDKYLSIVFYLCFAHAFSTLEANQNIDQRLLQEIPSPQNFRPEQHDLVSRLVEQHQRQAELLEREAQKSAENIDENEEQLTNEATRIEWLKKTVLKKLKLTAPPNITSSERIPLDSPVMQALFKEYGIDQSRMNEEDDEDEIKSQKLISTAKPLPFNTTTSTENWFFFDFAPEERENFRVKSASIWFYVRDTTSTSQAVIELDVVRSHLNTTDGELNYIAQRHSVKRFNMSDRKNKETWKHIPITNIASGWLQNPSRNFGIKLFSRQIRNLVANGLLPNEAGYKPFLEVELVADHHRRKRNAESECHETAEGGHTCCVTDLTINFHEIGWHWIIHPTSYNAKICQGDCYAETSSIIHTQVVRETQGRQMVNRSAQIGRANRQRNCCVPIKYKPLSMLFYDHSKNIVYSDVPDMEIKKCGCA